MKEENHLIRRTTLDLSTDHGAANQKLTDAYSDFFQKRLVGILEAELEGFAPDQIIQVDKWEFDLGDILNDAGADLSTSNIAELEAKFRLEIQKKIGQIKISSDKIRQPVQILKDFLITGKSESDHFLGREGIIKTYNGLSADEKSLFLKFAEEHQSNPNILKRLAYQFGDECLEDYLNLTSDLYPIVQKSLSDLLERQKVINTASLRDIVLQTFRQFWKDKVLGRETLPNREKIITGFLQSQQLQEKIPELELEDIHIDGFNVLSLADHDIHESENLSQFINEPANKVEREAKLLKYILEHGSLPQHEDRMTLDDLRSIIESANSAALTLIRKELPKRKTHLFWTIVESLQGDQLKKFVLKLIGDQSNMIKSIELAVEQLVKYKVLSVEQNSIEMGFYRTLLHHQSDSSNRQVKIDSSFFEQLTESGFSVHLEELSTLELSQQGVHEENELFQKLLAEAILFENSRNLEKKTGLVDADEIDSDKIELKDTDRSDSFNSFSPSFIKDLLTYYFMHGNLPWWADRPALYPGPLKFEATSSEKKIIEELVDLLSTKEQLHSLSKEWMKDPRSRNQVLFEESQFVRESIVNAAVPAYSGLSYAKFVQDTIDLLHSNYDSDVITTGLAQEILYALLPRLIKLGTGDIKEAYGLTLKGVAAVYSVSFEDLYDLLQLNVAGLSKGQKITSQRLRLLVDQIKSEEATKKDLGSSSGLSTDIELIQVQNIGVNSDLLFEEIKSFLQNGFMGSESLKSYSRYKQVLNELIRLDPIKAQELSSLFDERRVAILMDTIDRKYHRSDAMESSSENLNTIESDFVKLDEEFSQSQIEEFISELLNTSNFRAVRDEVQSQIVKAESEFGVDLSELITQLDKNALQDEFSHFWRLFEQFDKRLNPELIELAQRIGEKLSELSIESKGFFDLLISNPKMASRIEDSLKFSIDELKSKPLIKLSEITRSLPKSEEKKELSLSNFKRHIELAASKGLNQIEFIHQVYNSVSLDFKKVRKRIISSESSISEEDILRLKVESSGKEIIKLGEWIAFLESRSKENVISSSTLLELINSFEKTQEVDLSLLKGRIKKQTIAEESLIEEFFNEAERSKTLSSEDFLKLKGMVSEFASSRVAVRKEIDSLIELYEKEAVIDFNSLEAEILDFSNAVGLDLDEKKHLLESAELAHEEKLRLGDDLDQNEVKELEFYKQSSNVVFAVIRYFFHHRQFPWWSPYNDFADWQKWYNRLARSRPKATRELTHEILEDPAIRDKMLNYQQNLSASQFTEDRNEIALDEVSSLLGQIRNEFIQDKGYDDWFFAHIKNLFGTEIDLPQAQHLLLTNFYEKQVLGQFDIATIEKTLARLATEQSNNELADLTKELQAVHKTSQENLLAFEGLRTQVDNWVNGLYPDHNLKDLVDVLFKNKQETTLQSQEFLRSLIIQISSYIAISQGQTQANVVLSMLRKNNDSWMRSHLMAVSELITDKEWIDTPSDELLLYEIHNAASMAVVKLENDRINLSSLFELQRHIQLLENEIPSLYLLSIVLLEKKRYESISLKESIEDLLRDLESSNKVFERLKKSLESLLDSDWAIDVDASGTSSYHKIFSGLRQDAERIENSTVVDEFVLRTQKALSSDKDIFTFIENLDDTNVQNNIEVASSDELSDQWLEFEEGDRIFVSNAGLVMLWPFLPRLFKNLGYMDEKIFKDKESQERAVHLLQYIVDGEERSPEFILLLNKVICGIPISDPIQMNVHLTTTEKEEAELFLKTVIGKWEQMKNTTINVFRDSFLKRDGALQLRGEKWHLKVEHKSIDILLTKLPWGINMIKYPWINYLIFVEWNAKS